MRNFKLNKNRHIIKFRNDYYIVNEFTKNIFEILENCNNLEEFAAKIKLSIAKAEKLLKKLTILKEREFSKNIDLPSPIKVQWKITNKCNLKCKHCYLGELNQQSLTDAQILHIATKLANSKILEVTITGGEALLVPCITEVINTFVDKGITVKLFTNSTLLQNYLQNIKNHKNLSKFLTFSISVDGAKEAHETIRGAGTFDKTMAGIDYAISQQYNLVINCVVTHLNIKSIPFMVAELYQKGIKNIQLSNLIIKGNADNSLRPTAQEMREMRNQLAQYAADKPLNILYGDENENFENIYYDKLGNALGAEEWRCCAGLTRCVINYVGDVYCCPFCEEYKLGNILNQNLEEIWSNTIRYKFLKYLSKYKNSNGRMCIMAQRGDKNE